MTGMSIGGGAIGIGAGAGIGAAGVGAGAAGASVSGGGGQPAGAAAAAGPSLAESAGLKAPQGSVRAGSTEEAAQGAAAVAASGVQVSISVQAMRAAEAEGAARAQVANIGATPMRNPLMGMSMPYGGQEVNALGQDMSELNKLAPEIADLILHLMTKDKDTGGNFSVTLVQNQQALDAYSAVANMCTQ